MFTKEFHSFTERVGFSPFSQAFVIGLTAVNVAVLYYRNQQKRRNRDKILAPYMDEKDPDAHLRAWIELGDKHPDFIYSF